MKNNFNTLLSSVFTVEAIMTPTESLFTWPAEANAGELWARPEAVGYDLIPAMRNRQISGLWQKGSETPASLSHEWFISHNTAIPDLLRLFATGGSSGFLALYGQTIVGLVTPADLNKLPVRAYLYNLIGGLEVGLGRLLRNHFRGKTKRLKAFLRESSWEIIEDELGETKAGNVDVDPVEFLYISDLIDVVCKEPTLRQMLGYPSRNQIEKDLGGIVSLRNRIMHPIRPFLENVPEDLAKQHGRIERARALLRTLDELGLTQKGQQAKEERMGDAQEFVNDDSGYLRWLDRHPAGYVINTERSRNPNYMVLHEAGCRTIGRENKPRPGGYTGRGYIKICAKSIDDLRAWVRQNGRPDGSFSKICGVCKPS